MTGPVSSVGTGGKVVTAFVAGATLGVLAMVHVVPKSLEPGDILVLGGGGGGDIDEDELAALGIDPDELTGIVGDEGDEGALAGPAQSGGNVGNGGDGQTDDGSQPTGSGGAGGVDATGAGGPGGVGGAGGDAGGGGGGGDTDIGVTRTEIKVAATTVTRGPGATLLGPATIGMQAVINKVNSKGGIDGRRITLDTRNDDWDAARGHDFIRRFIRDGNFALLVVPSSEGLAQAIEAKTISNEGIPVIGSTGLRDLEYSDPWVFPVSTATVSTMRIMAQHAIDQGASTFGIVYDEVYRFGVEGKDAFVKFIDAHPKAEIKATGGARAIQPLHPLRAPYGDQARQFKAACGADGCDMVALLLVPDVAIDWRNANPGDGEGRGTKATHGAQTLFTNDFATRCNNWCDGMVVWTGYNPSIGSLADRPGIRQYRQDVRNVSPGADIDNQFLQGAYLGTLVFVEAVERCSPNVTRACIQSTLNQMDYQSDLASTLSWRPNRRHANSAARAFSMEASGGSFNGWTDQRTGFIQDPGL